MNEQEQLICVLCGTPWGVNFKYTNVCENQKCKGFCTWGKEPMKPDSFTIDDSGRWIPNPPPVKSI